MEYSLQAQTLQFLRAGALGLALGLHYDLLRFFRRKRNAPADLWFCLTVFLSLLALALYGGAGQLHLFMLVGVLLGACAWFSGPGRFAGPAIASAAEAWAVFRRRMVRKIKKICKKAFSNAKKSVKIIDVKMGAVQNALRKKRGDAGNAGQVQWLG